MDKYMVLLETYLHEAAPKTAHKELIKGATVYITSFFFDPEDEEDEPLAFMLIDFPTKMTPYGLYYKKDITEPTQNRENYISLEIEIPNPRWEAPTNVTEVFYSLGMEMTERECVEDLRNAKRDGYVYFGEECKCDIYQIIAVGSLPRGEDIRLQFIGMMGFSGLKRRDLFPKGKLELTAQYNAIDYVGFTSGPGQIKLPVDIWEGRRGFRKMKRPDMKHWKSKYKKLMK